MTLPLAEQLEKALGALRKYITADKLIRAQIEKMKKVSQNSQIPLLVNWSPRRGLQEIETLVSDKRKMEAELLRKQRILLDLRKFVPPAAAATVDSAIAGGWPAVIADMQTASLADQQNMQRAAQELLQATVATLKVLLCHHPNDFRSLHAVFLHRPESNKRMKPLKSIVSSCKRPKLSYKTLARSTLRNRLSCAINSGKRSIAHLLHR